MFHLWVPDWVLLIVRSSLCSRSNHNILSTELFHSISSGGGGRREHSGALFCYATWSQINWISCFNRLFVVSALTAINNHCCSTTSRRTPSMHSSGLAWPRTAESGCHASTTTTTKGTNNKWNLTLVCWVLDLSTIDCTERVLIESWSNNRTQASYRVESLHGVMITNQSTTVIFKRDQYLVAPMHAGAGWTCSIPGASDAFVLWFRAQSSMARPDNTP